MNNDKAVREEWRRIAKREGFRDIAPGESVATFAEAVGAHIRSKMAPQCQYVITRRVYRTRSRRSARCANTTRDPSGYCYAHRRSAPTSARDRGQS